MKIVQVWMQPELYISLDDYTVRCSYEYPEIKHIQLPDGLANYLSEEVKVFLYSQIIKQDVVLRAETET